MISIKSTFSVLPLIAFTNAWTISFSHEPNCATPDQAPAQPFSGDPGETFPEQIWSLNTEGIEPYLWQSFTVEDWDDNCVIEFYDIEAYIREEPNYVLESWNPYVHEYTDNTVCIYDVPGTTAGGDGTWTDFRYKCEEPSDD
ncbi:hypothetical protein CC79DRAFT_1361755 [Sarocladium strictum]